MGLENDPRLELLPPPLSLTSVFRDGHTHFFAPLWRKRDVWEPINPSCTCARVYDSQPDTGSRPMRGAAAHLCLLTTSCPFFPQRHQKKMHFMHSKECIVHVSNTWDLWMFCALAVLNKKHKNKTRTSGLKCENMCHAPCDLGSFSLARFHIAAGWRW